MESCIHIFQMSGVKTHELKRQLFHGIKQLGGRYIGGSAYQHAITHLIIPQVLSSEKFLAACAAGKWIVTPEFVLDSVKNGSWLAEEPYEVALSIGAANTSYPSRQWREEVTSGRLTGAFQGWCVLLIVEEPTRRAMFDRLLKAGKAEVYHCPPPSDTSITHVLTKPATENPINHGANCYPVSHIVQHLFGKNTMNLNDNITDDHSAAETKDKNINFTILKEDILSYVTKQEGRPRLCFLEFLGYEAPCVPPSQATERDFSNIGSMIDCGLFNEALEEMRSSVFPGVLPPLPYLVSLLEYAQTAHASSVFVRNMYFVMDNLIVTNPPWLSPISVKKYFSQLLQCPQCKKGSWPFLESAIRYCLSNEATCHPLPGPAQPTLVDFHFDTLTLFLKIFQGEFHSVTIGDLGRPLGIGVSTATTTGFLLYSTFWTMWERSTLLSSTVKKLTQLLVEAAIVDYADTEKKQKVYLADTLLDMLSVLVEFWCHHNTRLNPHLVGKGLKDLSEHIAAISHDALLIVLTGIVGRLRSTRLKLMVADAVFRKVCDMNRIAVTNEPLSYRKMVLSYLPVLGSLAQCPSGTRLRTVSTPHSCSLQETNCRTLNSLVNEVNTEKENIPRGFKKVNRAGETLLHIACKKNQVKTVLQILSLPGIDVNIEDNVGWTPLHEACNHGNIKCVATLLNHRPAPVTTSQVDGRTPLHDALLNGHMDIAKMLLEHSGFELLRQSDGYGRFPLDMVSAENEKEELLLSAQAGDDTFKKEVSEVSNLPLLEAGSTLLAHLIFTYHRERGVPRHVGDRSVSLAERLVQALEEQPAQKMTSGWTNQFAVRLVEDAETLLELSKGMHQAQVAQAVKDCKGENTMFLMELMDELKSRGEELAACL
ncbi:SMC5-SMC6 complex localization factor protein 1 isoform X2 [Gouania willdenowi]|uniref:SMC5-SMC6 complex localization factor protein 1 isoform X2 n=1 Tax=Gouania willdenowi TaxID=441366 RepID=UPI001055AAA1|nr:SMC5-SMC6 complex localization factor protein 1 isoform X2 [Gouania willdenowi]